MATASKKKKATAAKKTEAKTQALTVLCNSLCEGGKTYAKGDVIEVAPDRIKALGDSVGDTPEAE